ncbi:MAG: hypothetical protein SO373_03410 [Candidatus Borkfalkiaceae bacterium]|nr:hypothetical protein [Christensenellaceae bacterium]
MATEKESAIRNILNFRFPLLLRIPMVLGVMLGSVFISPRENDYWAPFLVGAFLFWLIYFVDQCGLMEQRTDSDFLEGVYGFIWDKGLWIAIIVSFLSVGYGILNVFLVKGEYTSVDMQERYWVSCAVIYPTITWILAFTRLEIAGRKQEIIIADGAIKYWCPFVLSPFLSSVISRFFLESIEVARVACIIIAVGIVLFFIISRFSKVKNKKEDSDSESNNTWSDFPYGKGQKATGMHKGDKFSDSDCTAWWISLTNWIERDGTYVINGTIHVKYVGVIEERSFAEKCADIASRTMIDWIAADVEKLHPECKSLDTSLVRVEMEYKPHNR